MECHDVSISGEIIWTDEAVEQMAALFLDLAEQSHDDDNTDAPIIPFRQRDAACRETSSTHGAT
ncbi:hypothetical protein Fuma_00109 [Fuerstiella marisgermanici]|uniref:Uncharacterized protein n=2 Tax=Fuerstiella marisgermanici TaxID=1891926 RepID=A0A1P8W907_9PLAN|nr:hypothetical protein Fuma_00109 [Fuerstiella marisgermanici]